MNGKNKMIDKYKIGWIVLNTQLLIAVVASYKFLLKHGVVHNVELFLILCVLGTNLFYFLLKKIKYFSLRSLLSVLVASLITSAFISKYNYPNAKMFGLSAYAYIALYLFIHFKLFVTTPLAVLFEIILRWKQKQK